MGRGLGIALVVATRLLGGADSLEIVFREATQALAAGDLAAAERGFQRVLKARPDHVGALGNLGVVYSRMDRVTEAIPI